MLRTCLIIFLLLQTALFADPPFEKFVQEPFVVHYVGKDIVNAQKAAKILAKAYDELVFDFQFEPAHHFDVYLMPTRKSFREALGGQLPDWTGAFANPMYNRMVVKSPRWDSDGSFDTSLVHELVHLVIHQYLGVRDIPRWMDEGLAIFYSGEKRWTTATALSKAISTNSIIPLSDIDYVLEYHQAKADLAYQQSYSAVRYLLKIYDIDAVRLILSKVRMGTSIQDSFVKATASSLSEFEMEWQAYARKTYKWMWFYEINDYVWLLILILGVFAFAGRWLRKRQIERQWRDEQLQAERLGPELFPPDDDNSFDIDSDETEMPSSDDDDI